MEELLSLLEPLDWSRQASWNLGRGFSDLTEGKTPALRDILPGLLGGGLGLGLAATGAGLPVALLGGSLFGALNQGAYGNKAKDPGEVVREFGGDPESIGGMGGSMLLSALTDPLTFGLTGAGIQGAKRLMNPRIGQVTPEAAAAVKFPEALQPLATTHDPGGIMAGLEDFGSMPHALETMTTRQSAWDDQLRAIAEAKARQQPISSELEALLRNRADQLPMEASLAKIIAPSSYGGNPLATKSLDQFENVVGALNQPASYRSAPASAFDDALRGNVPPSESGSLADLAGRYGYGLDESQIRSAIQARRDPDIARALEYSATNAADLSLPRSIEFREGGPGRMDTVDMMAREFGRIGAISPDSRELIDFLSRHPELVKDPRLFAPNFLEGTYNPVAADKAILANILEGL